MEQKDNTIPQSVSVESIQALIQKNKGVLEGIPNRLDLTFENLKWFWRTNLEEDKPQPIREFLQMSKENSEITRWAIEQSSVSGLGQPGLEIPVSTENFSPTFHFEIYHWMSKYASEKPVNVGPIIAAFTGQAMNPNEKSSDYIKRLSSVNKAKFDQIDSDKGKMFTFTVPIPNMENINVSGKVESFKKEENFYIKEVILDIECPYEIIETWLEKQVPGTDSTSKK